MYLAVIVILRSNRNLQADSISLQLAWALQCLLGNGSAGLVNIANVSLSI